MTIHLISVGMTIVQFLDDPYGRVDAPLADRIASVASSDPLGGSTADETADRLTACLTHREPALVDRLTRLCERVTLAQWPARASAELSTFASAGQIRTGLPIGDVAVLLTSDTTVGLNSALWNALALTGADLGRVTHLSDLNAPGAFASLRGRAVICRVPGLDVGSSAGFTQAMGYLGTLGRGLLDQVQEDGEDFAFYLSGGFKATIPYLIGLAEGVRSRTREPVRAWVLHDTSDVRIELPLRRLSRTTIDRELRTFVGVVSMSEPETNLLEGYAYDKVGREWRLTAFGSGLSNLYGTSNETV